LERVIMSLSVIIIAKNAQDLIKDAIFSVKDLADQIVVVDNNSTDKTESVAKKSGAQVFSFASESFARSRNFGLEKATGDWILYIDTDEQVTPELAANIKKVIKEDTSHGGYKIKRKNFYLGNHEWPYVEKPRRLFRKEKLEKWQGDLHESPVVNGKIGELDGYLRHFTHRDLASMLDKTIAWSKTEALLRMQAGHPSMTWWRFPRVMMSAFIDSYIRQGGYRAGVVGIIESVYQAFSIFVTYARLWEMQQKEK